MQEQQHGGCKFFEHLAEGDPCRGGFRFGEFFFGDHEDVDEGGDEVEGEDDFPADPADEEQAE